LFARFVSSASGQNPLPSFVLGGILVAENKNDNGPADTINFSAGRGIFLCYADNNLTASVSKDESAERSNVKYSSLPASYPNGEFFQFFGVSSV
jgi:hypothetical protein